MNGIYDQGIFDAKPDWLDWSINGFLFCDPIELLANGDRIESFRYFPKAEKRIQFSHKLNLEEILSSATQKTLNRAGGKNIAVLVSGRDSELVARLLKRQGGNVKIWHALYPFSNPLTAVTINTLEALASDLNVDLGIVDISTSDFVDHNYDFSRVTGVAEPALGGLSALIHQIPHDHYIVMGDGDIAKDPVRYNGIYNPSRYLEHAEIIKKFGGSNVVLPFILDEVMFRIWAQKKKRCGDFCFFQSDLEMIAAFSRNQDLIYDRRTGYISLEKIYQNYFPELRFRQKTDPFLHPQKGEFKNLLREDLRLRFGSAFNETGVGCCWLDRDYFL